VRGVRGVCNCMFGRPAVLPKANACTSTACIAVVDKMSMHDRCIHLLLAQTNGLCQQHRELAPLAAVLTHSSLPLPSTFLPHAYILLGPCASTFQFPLTLAVPLSCLHAIRRPGPAGLEDGTLPFTSISAARHGFAFISRLGGFPAVAAHAGVLADYLHRELAGLRHSNSAPVAAVYGRQAPAGTTHSTKQNEHNGWNHSQQQQQQQQQHVDGSSTQSRSIAWDAVCSTTTCNGGHQSSSSSVSYLDGWGPTVTFNLRRPDGSWVGYHEVRVLVGSSASSVTISS
jgi:hypothetical protein